MHAILKRLIATAGCLLLCLGFAAKAQTTVTVEYIHTDALGSPVAVTNEAGQVIERTQWEPYGAAIGKPAYDGPGYTGHVMDGATGLTYMQQRYYDPGIGRFLSVDPVTANSGTGANFNRYKYANNNPYKFIDPDGRVDLNLYSSANSPRLYSHSSNFDIPGMYTIGSHGGDDPFVRAYDESGYKYAGDVGSGRSLRANHLWLEARNNGLTEGMTAFLAICEVGKGGFASEFARMNKSTVYATEGYAISGKLPNGDIRVRANSKDDGNGRAMTFNPYDENGRGSGPGIVSVVSHKDGSATVTYDYKPTGSHINLKERIEPKKLP